MDFSKLVPIERLPTVTGSFTCQRCAKRVLEATLDEDSGELLYWCPDGHENSITL